LETEAGKISQSQTVNSVLPTKELEATEEKVNTQSAQLDRKQSAIDKLLAKK
jgi:hypothetical protein